MANSNQKAISETELVIKMLGREPRTPFKVQTRCPDGTPQVLLANPVFKEDGIWKPFPTFLWLLCPRLKKEVARLEQAGKVKEFSIKIETDPEFAQKFNEGQKELAAIRLEMAKEIMPTELPEHIEKILSETTIAGSMDIRGVKCLHSHVAQELAFNNNPIGKEVLEIIGNCKTDDNCMPIFTEGQEK